MSVKSSLFCLKVGRAGQCEAVNEEMLKKKQNDEECSADRKPQHQKVTTSLTSTNQTK